MATARLAPGTVLVTVPGRGLAVRTPDGTFLRVDTGAVDAQALVDHLTTGRPDVPGLGPLVTAFEDAGYARRADDTPPPLHGRTVVVLGDPELTGPLTRCVRDAGATVRTDLAEIDTPAPGAPVSGTGAPACGADTPVSGHDLASGTRTPVPGTGTPVPGAGTPVSRAGAPVPGRTPVSGAPALGAGIGAPGRTAVVWCLDRPGDAALWQEADRLPARGIAWLRCHREGAHAWLEPLACAPGDVTSAHVRLRRLAATPAHRELAAYWAGHRTPDRTPAHTEASAALTAALLTGDLIAWANGAPLSVRRRLRRIDLRDLTVTEHPVLPVPDVAPLDAPR
ncbi:hypothetical protein [Streptomyces sp. NPDC006368]|uniref:hypothetical protein n=1 Tax=Streptomyces sp. NPDC006368 TaxID=3156760 RepID=UPI00339FC167